MGQRVGRKSVPVFSEVPKNGNQKRIIQSVLKQAFTEYLGSADYRGREVGRGGGVVVWREWGVGEGGGQSEQGRQDSGNYEF